MTSILGDIRHVDFGGPYDLVMILYGEFNVFSPAEALTILNKVSLFRRVRKCLACVLLVGTIA